MTTQQTVSLDPNLIPPIGGQIPQTTPQMEAKTPESKVRFSNEPNEVSLSGFFGKVLIGLVVGGCISALLFAVLSAVGGMLGGDNGAPSAILGILLAFIGFIAGMLGNMGLALLYNLFFSKRYYHLGKMMGLIFTSSIIIFILVLPLYFLFQGGVATLFTILGVQILFSFFITSNLIEYLAQPNYSGSSLIGNVLGFILSIAVYLAMVQGIQGGDINNQLFLFMLLPTVIGYPIMLMGLGIWDAIYYKFFQWGNNPFYLPSLAELSKKDQEDLETEHKNQEEINVEIQ
jgi:hypothetical protein